MRRSLVLLIALGAAAAPAAADTPDDAGKATALLDQAAKAPSGDARLAAAKDLAALGAHARDTLTAFLARARASTIEERTAILTAFGASVPDKKGKFATPNREKDKQIRAGDDIDWLAELAAGDVTSAAVGEITADVAALRALGGSKDVAATQIIFDVAFADDTMIYRDECGRQLRALHPYSIPGLIRISEGTGYDRKRYATYQLERLDRQEPFKALGAAANDEDLTIAILTAFKDTRHREAVGAVMSLVDADAPRVRSVAREAWMAYVTGPPPKPAPKKKLVLPGGRLTDKEMPLYFTSRELADQLLRKQAEELWGETYGEKEKLDLEAMSKRLFAHHDAARGARDRILVDEARTQRDAGNLAGAVALFDRLLVTDENRPEKAEMAATYLAHADALAKDAQWDAAAASYAKAHGLDPEGASATHALASQHFALGKALEAAGKDGGAQFRKAAALEPHNEAASDAADAASGTPPTWMLLVGGAAALAAALFFGLGLMRRRA
jgi:tetratricopeptide (TPR) repeat protein